MHGAFYASPPNPNIRFENALSQARRRDLISRVFFRRRNLAMMHEELRGRQLINQYEIGIRQVKIDNIVGSVNRTDDFTKDFLPRRITLRDRWIRVMQAFLGGYELPPVTLVMLDDRYYVVDGHHRISVARLFGQQYISAVVTVVVAS